MTLLLNATPLLQGSSETTPLWDGGGQLSMLLVLFLLMCGALVAGWVYLQRGGMPKRKGEGSLNLLETRVLGGRQYLVVGEYGKRRFLLGVCPGRIDYLCPLDDREDGAAVPPQPRFEDFMPKRDKDD